MPLDLYLAFVLASAVLILIPGPNVTLLVANSLAYGAQARARHARRHEHGDRAAAGRSRCSA